MAIKKIRKIIDLYSLLNMFQKIKTNAINERSLFLSDEFFQAEINAIDFEIEKIKREINSLE